MDRGTRRRLYVWIPVFVVFAAVWAVLSLPSVQEFLIVRDAPPLGQPTAIDEPPLPMDIEFTLIDGTQVTGSSLRGAPAVINVFATWCPPCVADVPSLERLRTAVEPGTTVLMVALDKPDALARWTEDRSGDPAAFATANRFTPPLTTKSIPMTLVVDPQGNVVAKLTGAWRWDDPSVIEHLDALTR